MHKNDQWSVFGATGEIEARVARRLDGIVGDRICHGIGSLGAAVQLVLSAKLCQCLRSLFSTCKATKRPQTAMDHPCNVLNAFQGREGRVSFGVSELAACRDPAVGRPHLGRAHRILHREDAIVGHFDELTGEGEVGRTFRNDVRSAIDLPHQELADAERQLDRLDDRRVQDPIQVSVELQVPQQLLQKLSSGALRRLLLDEVADLVLEERDAVPHVNILGWFW